VNTAKRKVDVEAEQLLVVFWKLDVFDLIVRHPNEDAVANDYQSGARSAGNFTRVLGRAAESFRSRLHVCIR
jgi:hypothetical protein